MGIHNSLSPFWMSTSFRFEPFYVGFRWWHCFEIFRIRYKYTTNPTCPAFKAYLQEYSRKDLCRTYALDLGPLQIKGYKLLLLQKGGLAHQMVNWTDVHKVFGNLPAGLAHCEHSNNTPLFLPTIFLEVQTEPMLTRFLPSLVVQLVLQFHVFRICAE